MEIKVKTVKHLINIVLLTLIHFGVSGQSLQKDSDFQHEIWRVNNIINDPITLDSLVERVYANSGLVQSFNQEMGMYDEEIAQKKRNWVSSFRVGLNLISANTYAGLNNESVTDVGVLPNLGVTLSIDPEKFVNRQSYVRQANNKKQRSFYLQQDYKLRLKKELLGMHYDYLTMLETLVLNEQTLNTWKQHLGVMEIAFRGGTATYDQLLVVQNQLSLWESEHIKARIEAMKQRREIEVILGY